MSTAPFLMKALDNFSERMSEVEYKADFVIEKMEQIEYNIREMLDNLKELIESPEHR